MKKLLYFLFLSLFVMACSKNQESIQPVDEIEAVQQFTQLLVNVSVNEEEHNDCNGACNTKAPIANAVVTIQAKTADGEVTYEALTTAGGYTIFKNIPAHIYNLEVSCNYGDHKAKVNVEENQRVIIEVGF